MNRQKQMADATVSARVLSRRQALIVGGGVLVGAGVLADSAAAAATKMAQKMVSYRDKPQGNARCDGCAQWQAPASCKIVSGTISPNGWCTLYAPAPKS